MSAWKRLTAALLPVLILLALPLLLKPSDPAAATASGPAVKKLVLVTPHTEAIRYEFEHAFRARYRAKHGVDVEFDWRSVGGTSDIVRYIADRFEAEFRRECEQAGVPWDAEAAKRFKDPRASASKVPVRKRFLESDTGIGIDLFFGGGTYDHDKFARIGYGVGAGTELRHPEWFAPEIIPQTHSGETIYDPRGRFYGVCLSSFGIAYNLDRFADLGLPPPDNWTALCSGGLFRKIEAADPTKSGSITKCYEMILQQAMAEYGVERGWEEGFFRIRLIAANARLVTDSAGKLVRDVSSGAAAAGMCIDFYGFSEAEFTNALAGRERIRYLMPRDGSAVTADPIQLLRGAPNSDVAKEFIDFTLSPEGQALWMQKVGTPGGPVKYPLLRPCVRKDLYSRIPRDFRSHPDYDPYALSGTFRYHGEWTGRYFNLIRVLIKCAVLDPGDDLRAAWSAVLANGGPDRQPEAMALLRRPPVPWTGAKAAAEPLNGTPAEVAAARREWTESAAKTYRRARSAVRPEGGR